MTPRRAAILALGLLAASCGPRPAVQAELCAIRALPERPGLDAFGDPAVLTVARTLETRGQTQGQAYGPALWPGPGLRHWGRCPAQATTTEMILLGPGPYAMSKGGPRDRGRQTAFGTCYHLKTGGRWRSFACRINGQALSPTGNSATPLPLSRE